ncbi:hypothetical protein BaRGS_00012110 [Batillaria attramentaria]|uniref:Uncharacterized protein n=1 Tax=Batillaria attramentaria TaxID=370345 RepID=A0ABD0LBE5_9CAEN
MASNTAKWRNPMLALRLSRNLGRQNAPPSSNQKDPAAVRPTGRHDRQPRGPGGLPTLLDNGDIAQARPGSSQRSSRDGRRDGQPRVHENLRPSRDSQHVQLAQPVFNKRLSGSGRHNVEQLVREGLKPVPETGRSGGGGKTPMHALLLGQTRPVSDQRGKHAAAQVVGQTAGSCIAV